MTDAIEKKYDFISALECLQEIQIFLNNNKEYKSIQNPSDIKILNKKEKIIFSFQFPFIFPKLENKTLDEYLDDFPEYPPNYLVLLIQGSGNAAIGHFEEGEILNHKVVRKYMVRKKQGKSQINHLKTKGKSKLGSRIRLQNTIDFFEEINQKLIDWEVEENVDYIFYYASIQVWNLLFESKISPPFDKKDDKIIKIPLDIQDSNYDELIEINDFLQTGIARFYDETLLGMI